MNQQRALVMWHNVAGMEEFLVDFPCVKELLANLLKKLQSSEAMHLECSLAEPDPYPLPPYKGLALQD